MAESNISELLTEKDCYKILEHHTDQTVSIINYEIYKADSKVIGYLGDHFRVKISYQRNSDSEFREDSFFIKTKPIFNTLQAEYVDEVGLFEKECLFYKNIIPKLSAIAGVHLSPKCFLVNERCIVLEDLMLRNFKMAGRYLYLDECESLVTCLAKFHCATIVYEELNSTNEKKYRLNVEFKTEVRETAFSFIEGQPRNKWLKNVTKCTADCIELLPNVEYKNELIAKLYALVFNEMETLIGPSEKYRNCVTHADLWSNNFMINDKFECILIDFQLARYNPPAYDLMLTLFLNTTKVFLEKNLENLLNLYYDTFQSMLLQFGLKPEKVFPRDDFMDSVEQVKLPTLLEAVFFLTNTSISNETSSYVLADAERYKEFTFINRSKYIIKEFEQNEVFKGAFLELLMPLVELLMKKQ